ncbi:MAG: YihY family inner membrane protein [Burkholderiales bacterium]
MPDTAARLRQMLASMLRQAGELRLQQTASSLTLLTLMAVVPMAAAGLLVLAALPAFGVMRANVQRFVAENLFLPSFSETVVGYIESFVGSAEQLSALGTVIFLATALSAMLTIDRTLNDIWRAPRARPLAQRLALYWGVLTLGPVLLGLALGLQLRVVEQLGDRALMVEILARMLPIALGVTGLTLVYRLAPNARVRWSHALLGALVAAALVEALRRLLGVYIARFPSYTVVYGAFAALPLLLLWLFAIWMSVLVGALVAANLPQWGLRFDAPRAPTPAAEFDRVVRVLTEIVRAAPQRVPSARFLADFGGDPIVADRVASLLAAHGYIVRVWPVSADGGPAGVWDEWWLPSAELPSRTLKPVFDRVWRGAPDRRPALRRDGGGEAGVDPGGALLSRPIGEVLAAPPSAG